MMINFGLAAVLGICFGFMFGIGCSLAVLYAISLGGYRKVEEEPIEPVKPKRHRRRPRIPMPAAAPAVVLAAEPVEEPAAEPAAAPVAVPPRRTHRRASPPEPGSGFGVQ
jgi:hypothetical protein